MCSSMDAFSCAFITPSCFTPQRTTFPDTMLLRALVCRTSILTSSFYSWSASILTTSPPFSSSPSSSTSFLGHRHQSLHDRRRSSHTSTTEQHRRFACTATTSIPPPDALDLSSPSDDARTRNADKNAVAVVVGASRGIGLAVVQNLVTRWSGHIVATCRNVDDAGALSALWQFMPDRFSLLSMDVCDEESIKQVAEQLKSIGEEPRVDLVFHSAGILHEDGHMPETSLSKVDIDFMRRNLEINLMGPVLVAKHLSPLMTTARKPNRVPSVLATISARVGSIGDNNLGGWLSYRASKAGQNQAMRTISIELGRRGVICTSLHPGTVRTDLSAPFQKRVPESQLQEVDIAAGRLLDVIDSLTPSDNGSFFAYDGKRIPY